MAIFGLYSLESCRENEIMWYQCPRTQQQTRETEVRKYRSTDISRDGHLGRVDVVGESAGTLPAEGGAAVHGAGVEEGDQGEDSGGEGREVTSSPQFIFCLCFNHP